MPLLQNAHGFTKSALKAVRSGLVCLTLAAPLGACGLFGSDEVAKMDNPTTTLGVNGYLWQATLDTLSFMPIESAEPAAAVILTDWYSLQEAPDERVRVAVRFLSEDLRSDGVKVSIVRQEKKAGEWLTVPTQATTVLRVEEAILTQARKIRVSIEE